MKKPVKIDWNIAFTWLKHNVKHVGVYENTAQLRFRLDFTIIIFFVDKAIQTSSFVVPEKSSRLLWEK